MLGICLDTGLFVIDPQPQALLRSLAHKLENVTIIIFPKNLHLYIGCVLWQCLMCMY